MSVLLQILHIQESTNLIRVTTGLFLGMAASLYLFPRAQETLELLSAREDETSRH
jgi:uncharacterized membrane protein